MKVLLTCAIAILALAYVLSLRTYQPSGYPKNRLENYPLDDNLKTSINEWSFDFVIVGSGPAGCVLAKRLSEDGNSKVLLLEAGPPDNRTEIYMPGAFSQLFNSEYDWNYTNVIDPTYGAPPQILPRGRTLGGSTSLNAMIMNRGLASDYDNWAKMGNEGWSWNDVLPIFKKMEHNYRRNSNPEFHGFSGELKVDDSCYAHEATKTYLKSLANITNIPYDDDQMDGSPLGPALTQVNVFQGLRFSFAEAYLNDDVVSRPNLVVRAYSHVTKVLIENNVAVGVEFKDLLTTKMNRVFASKEVILAAGAFNTPQLLMLSGIGPKEHLQAHGIKVVKHAPGVGQNLQDHILIGVTYNTTGLDTLNAEQTPQNIVSRWYVHGEGPMCSNVGESVSFMRSRFAGDLVSDMQIEFGPIIFIRHGMVQFPGMQGVSSGPIMMNPLSRGYVELASADPFAAPIIDHRYLSEKRDMQVLLDGIRLVRTVLKAALGPYLDYEIVPGVELQTDEELEAYIGNYFMTDYHHCGTAKMGPASDPMAVVNKDLEVYGIQNLRVVDASIMPQIIIGNPQYPVGMIAEKIATVILQKYNLVRSEKKDEL